MFSQFKKKKKMLNVFIHKLGVDASIRKEKCRVNVFIPKNKGVNVSVDNKQKQRVSIFIKKEERRVFILKEQLRETVLIQKLKGPKSCNLTTCLNCCNCIHFADIYIYIYILQDTNIHKEKENKLQEYCLADARPYGAYNGDPQFPNTRRLQICF